MDDVFLTTGEVLEYLQVNLRTVYRLIKAGKIPAVRVGRQWRFRKADIDRWLEGQQTTTPGPGPSPAPRPAAGPPARDAQPAAPPRVLVADDEESIRDLLSKALTLAEYEVDAVPDGRTAIARLRAGPYDLLITDLKMPGIDGLTLIREARRLAPALPVVVITAYSSEASAIEAINLGVTAYLIKPFRITKILATAAKALGE